jgi:hypothetical protein
MGSGREDVLYPKTLQSLFQFISFHFFSYYFTSFLSCREFYRFCTKVVKRCDVHRYAMCPGQIYLHAHTRALPPKVKGSSAERLEGGGLKGFRGEGIKK